MDGARQILDALLVCGHGGHAPGTQVRVLRAGLLGRRGTIVGLTWGESGPPTGYRVRVHHCAPVTAGPEELVVLAGQESGVRHDLSSLG